MRKRAHFTREFKLEAVRLLEEGKKRERGRGSEEEGQALTRDI